jgi:lysophospholipase L1-like esterase
LSDDSEPDSLVVDETYPEDIDLLEEIIQSYYLILDSQSITQQYPMLDEAANLIQNDSSALSGFYAKLAELRSGQRDRVTILQIGDSHIQPGYFSGTARAGLQRYFGNAGRGLVFPWKLAGTNQPDDIRISSTSAWQRSNNEIGICGYGLQTQAAGNLVIQTNNFFQVDNSFDSITLILKEQQNSYAWKAIGLDDELKVDIDSFADQSVYRMNWVNPVRKVELSFSAANLQDQANLYGIILERQQPGLLYHAIGVNGASLDRFSKIEEFFPQIRILNPDLIIVSLGTNDTQGRFREEVYQKTLKQFMKNLNKAVPRTPLIFTLPPDSRKNGRANLDIAKANAILTHYCTENGYAWWDLQAVMGGSGAISKWRKTGLAAGDYKHFTPKGYMLQGQLFYQALIKGYKNYAEKR